MWGVGGGGGWQIGKLGRNRYIFSPRARLENLFLGKPRTEYLFPTSPYFCKAKKKRKKKERYGGEGGGES